MRHACRDDHNVANSDIYLNALGRSFVAFTTQD
jgi:hypothetical protein